MWIIFDVAIGMYKKKNTVNKKNFTRTSRFFSSSWRNLIFLCQLLYRLTVASLRFAVGTNWFAAQPDFYQLYLGISVLWITGLLAEPKRVLSLVCLDIIQITRISAVLVPFLCWKPVLMNFEKYVHSFCLGPVTVVLLSKVTCVKKGIVLPGVWHAGCQASGTLGCSPPPPVHVWSSVSHRGSQTRLIIWLLFQSQICIVTVKEAKQKHLVPGYS